MNDITQEKADAWLAQIGPKKVSFKELMDITGVGMTVLAKHLLPRLERIEKELAELRAEQSKTIADAYRGTWMLGSVYTRGSLVTWGGSLWLALAETSDKPGTAAWKMVVKAGRDAKDARP